MAKKGLVEGQSRLCGKQVAVEWLEPDLKQHFSQQLVGPSLWFLGPDQEQVGVPWDLVCSATALSMNDTGQPSVPYQVFRKRAC